MIILIDLRVTFDLSVIFDLEVTFGLELVIDHELMFNTELTFYLRVDMTYIFSLCKNIRSHSRSLDLTVTFK